MRSPRSFVVLVALVMGAAACSSGADDDAERTTTSRRGPSTTAPLPPPVSYREEPERIGLADPSFDALPGAEADYGRLGGSVYQLEVPERWNGRLVLWMHGFEEFASEASVSAPDIRAYLIAHGFAWGASSFSSTAWIPGRAVEETAALWDHFTSKYERPRRTFVIGLSMGGAAAHIAAERQPERFDGVLGLCGSAGASPGLEDITFMFVAAAYAAGLTQADYDATSDIAALIDEHIRPALHDRAVRDRFERIYVDLTGGPRPYDRAGLWAEQDTNWRRAKLSLTAGVVPPLDEPYRLGPLSDVESATFNREAIVPRTDVETLTAYTEGNELTGKLRLPLLTLHTTGDGQVPIRNARVLRDFVDDADARDLLVQRVYRDPGHCGFSSAEWVDAFEDLVAWVDDDREPLGIDVLTDDFAEPAHTFELAPRPGTRDADRVRGAEARVVLRGTATLDGTPFDSRFLGAAVLDEGLMAACQYELEPVEEGRFEISVFAAAEQKGCGGSGARIVLWTFANEAQVYSVDAIPWPGDGAEAQVSIEFVTAEERGAVPPVSSFVGDVLDADGNYAAPGTRVEALVGATVCGRTSTRRTGSFGGYTLMVVGPVSVPACREGAALEFRVDGRRAEQTARHRLEAGRSAFDLTLP